MTIYYGLFADGTSTEALDLNNIKDIPDLVYFFRKVPHISSNGYDTYKYIPINKHDQYQSIKVGDFELRDIGAEYRNAREVNRPFTIYDHRRLKLREDICHENGIEFFKLTILPLLNKLNELGSLEAYEQSLEIEKLRNDNQRLNDKVISLKKLLEEAVIRKS